MVESRNCFVSGSSAGPRLSMESFFSNCVRAINRMSLIERTDVALGFLDSTDENLGKKSLSFKEGFKPLKG